MVKSSPGDGAGRSRLIWALFVAVAGWIVCHPPTAGSPLLLRAGSAMSGEVEAAAPPVMLSSLQDGRFSAARAWTDVEALAAGIGRRVSGTEAATRTADYIQSRLLNFGVETERQVADGIADLDGTSYIYRGV